MPKAAASHQLGQAIEGTLCPLNPCFVNKVGMATPMVWQILNTNHNSKAQLESHTASAVTECVISLSVTTEDV